MRDRSISVTEAARNFADCVARVRYQGLSFQLIKNGIPVARLVPEDSRVVAEELGRADRQRMDRLAGQRTAATKKNKLEAESHRKPEPCNLQW